METIHTTAAVQPDGTLHIDVSSSLAAGPVEVVLVVHPLMIDERTTAERLEAVEQLARLDLPVADIDTMNREATPGPDELLP